MTFRRGPGTGQKGVCSRDALPRCVSLPFRGTPGFGKDAGRLRATRMSDELQSVHLRFRDGRGLSSPSSDFTDWRASGAQLPRNGRGGRGGGEREEAENSKHQAWGRTEDARGRETAFQQSRTSLKAEREAPSDARPGRCSSPPSAQDGDSGTRAERAPCRVLSAACPRASQHCRCGAPRGALASAGGSVGSEGFELRCGDSLRLWPAGVLFPVKAQSLRLRIS